MITFPFAPDSRSKLQESQKIYSRETGLVREVLRSEYIHPKFPHLQPQLPLYVRIWVLNAP